MAQRIDVSGVGLVEFPDGMSQEDIVSALNDHYGAKDDAPSPVLQIQLNPYQKANLASMNAGQGRLETGMESGTEFTASLPSIVSSLPSLPGKAMVALADIPTRLSNIGKHPDFKTDTLQERIDAGDGKIIRLPRLEGKDVEGGIVGAMSGLDNLLAGTAESFLAPESAFTMALIPGQGSIAKAAALLFGTQQAAALPGQVVDSLKVITDPNATMAQKVEAIGQPAVSSILGYTMLKHGLKKPSAEFQGPLATGEALRGPDGAMPPRGGEPAPVERVSPDAEKAAAESMTQRATAAVETAETPATLQKSLDESSPTSEIEKSLGLKFNGVQDYRSVLPGSEPVWMWTAENGKGTSFTTPVGASLETVQRKAGIKAVQMKEGINDFAEAEKLYDAQRAKVSPGEAPPLPPEPEIVPRGAIEPSAEAPAPEPAAADAQPLPVSKPKETPAPPEPTVPLVGEPPGEAVGNGFVPDEPAASPPKLRPGEKAGEMFQGKDQPFNLAGENAADFERIAAEKEKAARDKAEAERIQKEQQPEMVGMGGAVPGEFGGGQDYVSNMFAAIDRDRAAMGRPPMPKTEARTWDEDNQRALARMNRDPEWIPNLIKEVTASPRPLLSWENAGLVWQRAKWKAELNNALMRINRALEDKRPEDMGEAKAQAAVFEDNLMALDEAVGRNGTGSEAGRSLQAQKMAAGEDFTLVELRLRKQAALGRKLTEAEQAEIGALHAKLEATEKAHAEYVAKTDARLAQMAMDEAMRKMALEAAQAKLKAQPAIHPKIFEAAQAIVKEIDDQADAARAFLRGKSFSIGDPQVMIAITKIGVSHLAHAAMDFGQWSARMVQDLGEKVKPHLDEIFKASKAMLDERLRPVPEPVKVAVKTKATKVVTPEEKRAVLQGKVVGKVRAGKLDAVTNLAQKLGASFIESGVHGRDAVHDAVHALLAEMMPEWTRRDTMDALSGYGRFKQLSKDVIQVELRGYKGEWQQMAKIEDIQNRQPPLKTGVERREATDEERRLIKLVNEAKRRYGIVITDPATQLKSALDSRKTYRRNQITDLESQIAAREKFVKSKTPSPTDPELEGLKARHDVVKKEFDAIFQKPGLTNAERVKLALDSATRSQKEWEQRLQDAKGGTFGRAKQAQKLSSPEIEAVRARTEALRAEVQQLYDLAFPKKTPQQIALQTYKTRLAHSMADLRKRLANGDFSTRPRRQVELDPQAQRLKADNERLKNDFRAGLINDRLKNRTWWEKGLDWGTKYRRAGVLTSPLIFPKLISAGVQRLASLPLEELAGEGLRRLPGVSGIDARAPLEGGGLNVRAEMKGYGAAFTSGMRDAYKVLRKGHSDLDVLYGKANESYTGEAELGSLILAVPGRTHGMIKAPVKRAAFERAVQRLGEFYHAQGLDVTDDFVKTRIVVDAYKAANRAIFLGDNWVASKVSAFISEGKDPTLGRKAWSTAGRVALPIVRVPTNIAAETMQYAAGLPMGGARVLGATAGHRLLPSVFKRGVADLKPEEADLVMRELKKGSIGAAVLVLGYFSPNTVGGYYQPGEKRGAGDVKAGHIKIYGVDVPSLLLHNPLLETLQIGATVRRVADAKLRKKDSSTQGTLAGVGAAALGVVEQVPFVREMSELEKIRNPQQRGPAVGELAKSIAVPYVVQKSAEWTDSAKKRKPRTVIESIKTGIPGLRQTVPEAKR